MRTKLVFYIVLFNFFTISTYAQEAKKFTDFSGLIMTGEAQVEQIIDPLRLRLLDGRIIQLTGLDIPDLTPYDTGDIGMAVLDDLRDRLVKKTVKIYQTKNANKGRTNRMGYHLAHIVGKNSGAWVQGHILSEGLARVRPSALNIEMAAPMLALEHQARQNEKGLWADPQYAVLTPDTAEQSLHGWAVVEGTIRASAMAQNTVYLNFGPDWRNDFTIGIKPPVRRQLTNMNIDPLQFANQHVRVHGWLESYNGPYIELMHPAWLEIIDEPLPQPSEASTLPAENN